MGEYAMDYNDVVNEQLEVNIQTNNMEDVGWTDWPFNGDDEKVELISICQPSISISISSKKTISKKRKSIKQADERLVSLMDTFYDQTNARLGILPRELDMSLIFLRNKMLFMMHWQIGGADNDPKKYM